MVSHLLYLSLVGVLTVLAFLPVAMLKHPGKLCKGRKGFFCFMVQRSSYHSREIKAAGTTRWLDVAGYFTPIVKKQTDPCPCSLCFPFFIHYGILIQIMLQPTKGGTSYFNNSMEIASHRQPRSFPKKFYASSSWQLRLIATLPHRTLTPSRLSSVWGDSTISGSFTLKTFLSPRILIVCLPPPIPPFVLSAWLQGHLVHWFLHHASAEDHQMYVLGLLRNPQHASLCLQKSHR